MHACVFTHFIDFSLLSRVLTDLFKTLELLSGVDSLFALGTLLAHLGDTWGLSAVSEDKTRPPKNDLKWHLSPFTRPLLSICCVSPGLPPYHTAWERLLLVHNLVISGRESLNQTR